MRRVICRHGETQPGTTTISLERRQTTLVLQGVPARVCQDCGEAYLDEVITARRLGMLASAVQAGAQVAVCHDAAA